MIRKSGRVSLRLFHYCRCAIFLQVVIRLVKLISVSGRVDLQFYFSVFLYWLACDGACNALADETMAAHHILKSNRLLIRQQVRYLISRIVGISFMVKSCRICLLLDFLCVDDEQVPQVIIMLAVALGGSLSTPRFHILTSSQAFHIFHFLLGVTILSQYASFDGGYSR